MHSSGWLWHNPVVPTRHLRSLLTLTLLAAWSCGSQRSVINADNHISPEVSEKYGEICHNVWQCMRTCDEAERDTSLQNECDAQIKRADQESVGAASAQPKPAKDEFGGGWIPASKQNLTPSQIAARSRRAIVAVHAGSSMGTGFAIWRKGWIATNLHVVAGEEKIYVTLADQTKHRVLDVRGLDIEHDLVVLRIEKADLLALTLGDRNQVEVGERVVVIGNPLGLEATVSDGLVSASRTMDDGSQVFQISAPISPGSSGGPIINEHGQVIAVATFLLRGGQNLNFGMSSEYLAPMLKRRQVLSPAKFAAKTSEYRVERTSEIERHVPDLPVSTFEGCAGADVDITRQTLEETRATAEAVLEAGKLDAAAHVYLGATVDLRGKLSSGCTGVLAVLDQLKMRTAGLAGADKVGAFRDTFEGLLLVIEKRRKASK